MILIQNPFTGEQPGWVHQAGIHNSTKHGQIRLVMANWLSLCGVCVAKLPERYPWSSLWPRFYLTMSFSWILGEAPSDVTAVSTEPERVQVSWTPPSAPPGNGYQITSLDFDRRTSITVNVSRSPHTIEVAPGFHIIQVRSLSQHYPGRTAEKISISVIGKEALLESDVWSSNLITVKPV